MTLYDDIFVHKTKETTDGNVKRLFHELFNVKNPLLFKMGVENPENFKEYIFNLFNMITQDFDDYDIPLYKGANILTLLFCATYHIGKLYIKTAPNDQKKKAAEYYNDVLAELLDKHDDRFYHLNCKENVPGFMNCYQYALLMHYVSVRYSEADTRMADTVYGKYLQVAIEFFSDDSTQYYQWNDASFGETMEFDVMHDIFDIILDTGNPLSDMYDSNLKDVVNSNDFYDKHEIAVNHIFYVYGDSAYSLEVFQPFREAICYDCESYDPVNPTLGPEGHKLRDNLLRDLHPYINTRNLKLLLLFNNLIELFDEQTISTKIFKMACELIETTEDIERDVMFFLINMEKHMLFKNKQTIWHYIFRNPNFEDHARFVALLLNSVCKQSVSIKLRKYDAFEIDEQPAVNSILFFDQNGDNALLLLLARLFPDVLANNEHSIPSDRRSKAFGDNNSLKSYESPYDPQIKKYFKSVIVNLIKFCKANYKKQKSTISMKRFVKVLSYKNVLKQMGIDVLNLLKYNVEESPVSISDDKRSMNRSPAKSISENSLFKGFIDDGLMLRLEKIYTKSMQSDDQSADNFDRIIEIRKYIQSKYNYMVNTDSDTEIKLELSPGQELDVLFNIWIHRAKYQLTVKYFIKYKNQRGVDIGGLTTQFFSSVTQQIKDKYFEPIEGSDRHVFKWSVVTSDIAEFIGQFLFTMIMKGYKIDFNISYFYLALLMFKSEHLTDEEKFIYYLQDIDPIKKNSHIVACSDQTLVGDLCDLPIIIEDNFDAVYHYNQNVAIFDAFCKGFTIKKKMFYSVFYNIADKVRIYDMDKLITQTDLTYETLKNDIFSQIILNESNPENMVYKYFKEIMLGTGNKRRYKAEYKEMYDAFDTSIMEGDQQAQTQYEMLRSDYEFKKNVLMFWTGSKGVVQNPPYKVVIVSDKDLPAGRTCFNQLDLPLPDKIRNKQELFDIFMKIFIFDENKTFGMA
jgi:hypothetical protein